MNLLKRVHGVILPLGLYVSGMGLFGRVKRAQINKLPSSFDLGLILPVSGQPSTKKAGLAVAPDTPLVLAVLGSGHVPKVAQAVVVSDPVDVVNVTLRPDAVNVKPSKSMLFVLPPKQANGSVSLGLVDIPRTGSGFGQLISRHPAGEHSRLWVVVQKLFQLSLRDCIVGVSHVVAPYQRSVGQRLEGVGSTFLPRSIIGEVA